MNERTPVLVYDMDCSFCQYCVDYAARVTGEVVLYRGWQEVAGQYPAISEEQFKKSIWLFDADGGVYSGAHAAFKTLAFNPKRRRLLWMYKHIPLSKYVFEFGYFVVSRNRNFFFKVVKIFDKNM